MTLKKVAQLAGVSRTTVSLVVNNIEGSRVGHDTKERVLKAVRELDYRPNLIAQRLSLRKSDSIGLYIPFSSPLFSNSTNVDVIGGVQEIASERGMDLVLLSSGKNYRNLSSRPIEGILRQNAVDGIVVCNTRFSTRQFIDDTTRIMKGNKSNSVLLEYYWGDEPINYVGADYEGGIYQSITHLIKRGHRTIGLITPPNEALITRVMIDNYEKAFADSNTELPKNVVVQADFRGEMAQGLTLQLIGQHPDLTAIFVGDYEMALTCTKAIKQTGLKIPEDVSVVSFADHDVFPFLDPPLAAVSIPYYEMGKRAAELLMEDSPAKRRVILPTELVTRGSTAPANPQRAR